VTSGVTDIDRTDKIVLRIGFLLMELINRLITADVLRISELEST